MVDFFEQTILSREREHFLEIFKIQVDKIILPGSKQVPMDFYYDYKMISNYFLTSLSHVKVETFSFDTNFIKIIYFLE